MKQITSLTNPTVKQIVKLRERRTRDQFQRMVVDGVREISRALATGVEQPEVFVCSEFIDPAAQELLDTIAEQYLPTTEVSAAVMQKMAFGQRAEAVLLVADLPQKQLSGFRLPAEKDALVVVLEQVEKPGNLGAVLRSADAAGVAAVIVADGVTDLYNPNAIRASLGTIFSVPVFSVTSAEAIAWLRQQQVAMFAAKVDAMLPYTQARLQGRAAVILGSEAHGLTDAWNLPEVTGIQLPMLGIADSLNVSTTAAVLCYEALRQRNCR